MIVVHFYYGRDSSESHYRAVLSLARHVICIRQPQVTPRNDLAVRKMTLFAFSIGKSLASRI